MLSSILHLSHFDEYGGSARSAQKVHRGLRELGIRSRMLVGHKDGNDPDVRRIARSDAIALADRVAHRAADQVGLQYVANASSFLLKRDPWFREADVLQLYNIHGGWFALTALPRLARAKPIVWRLSDMWAMTGHCGYSLDSERWAGPAAARARTCTRIRPCGATRPPRTGGSSGASTNGRR